MSNKGLAEIATYEAWYYRKKYEDTLDRLHQCKRRNREDKVKLRNKMRTLESTVSCWYNAHTLLSEECEELKVELECFYVDP